jgi:alpha-mannosidase
MYNLHGWTADGPIDRHDFATYMRKQQSNISLYVDSLFSFSSVEMGKMIDAGDLQNVVYVFNTLNWERNGFVDITVQDDFTGIKDLVSGETINGLVIDKGQEKILRIYVSKIPSTGYKLVQLVKAEKALSKEVFKFSQNKLETPFYLVKLSNSGAISSLFDKKLKKEWVKSWVNDLGGTDQEKGENIQVVEKDAKHIKLLCRSELPVKHECVITFYDDTARMDFENTIQQNFDGILHWSFDFNVANPEIWHEETGAVIMAKLASAGGHYANKMARYDYLTLNHFVNVGNGLENITLSNADCLFFKTGKSTTDFLDMNASVIHVLIGGQVNDNLGMIKQDGDSVFHQNFSLLPQGRKFDQGESMRFALEHQNPLVAGYVSGGGELTEMKYSFLKTDNKNTILWTLKPGEEDGITLRLWNMESQSVATKTAFGLPLQKAMFASHVETNITEIPVAGNTLSTSLNKYQLKTFRIWLK